MTRRAWTIADEFHRDSPRGTHSPLKWNVLILRLFQFRKQFTEWLNECLPFLAFSIGPSFRLVDGFFKRASFSIEAAVTLLYLSFVHGIIGKYIVNLHDDLSISINKLSIPIYAIYLLLDGIRLSWKSKIGRERTIRLYSRRNSRVWRGQLEIKISHAFTGTGSWPSSQIILTTRY